MVLPMKTEIYYNSRCSKCRQTLALLQENGIEPNIIEYLEKVPSKRVLGDLIRKLGVDPREIVRFKETIAKELGLGKTDERTKAEWVQILSENPILLERPIVVHGDRAVIGRPPENVLGLL